MNAKQVDTDNAVEIINQVIEASKRELYIISFKVKKRTANNVRESVSAINWVPVSRPIALTPEEYEYLTVGMADDPVRSSIIMMLLTPGPGLVMADIKIDKAKGNHGT